MKDQSDDLPHHEWMLYHRAMSHSSLILFLRVLILKKILICFFTRYWRKSSKLFSLAARDLLYGFYGNVTKSEMGSNIM